MLRTVLATLAILVLSGCATLATPEKQLVVRSSNFEVHIVEKLPHRNDTAHAVTVCNFYLDLETNKVENIDGCRIYIKESVYPMCLAHEIRHVFEGDWHPRGAGIYDHPYYREDC